MMRPITPVIAKLKIDARNIPHTTIAQVCGLVPASAGGGCDMAFSPARGRSLSGWLLAVHALGDVVFFEKGGDVVFDVPMHPVAADRRHVVAFLHQLASDRGQPVALAGKIAVQPALLVPQAQRGEHDTLAFRMQDRKSVV